MSRLTGPLKIETLANGGKGIARFDGKVLFVSGVVPGDLAICRLTKEKKRFAEAELVQLVEPSALRRSAHCPVFGRCGGCQWQEMDYTDQCRWKDEIFRDLLQRQAGASTETILPIVPAPDEWNYRSRVQLKTAYRGGCLLTGFYRPGSHIVVDIDDCPVADKRLNSVLSRIKRHVAESPFAPSITQIDLGVGDDDRVRVTIHVGQDVGALAEYCRPLAERVGFSLFLQSPQKRDPLHICGPVDLKIAVDRPPLQLAYGPGGFSQINLQQNQNLIDAALDGLQLCGSENALDLYCGMGNFSLPMARKSRTVTAVEDYALSITKGRENAASNGIENISFECRPAEGFLSSVAEDIHYDIVLLDPPRSGAKMVMKELLEHRPEKIAYVSCDPATLARDLKYLLDGRYRLISSRPYDMFPQTYHIESLTLLELHS